jgi:hypothetical protein
MPIIIEGGSRSAGWWWAQHLQNTEKNERTELIQTVGLDSETVPELFREMHAMSLGSKTKNYFYQANINPRADEHLTPAQRRESVETLGRNLGLGGQPHFVIEHEKEGRTHQHVIWLRVDLERMKAIPDSLTARIHEQTSRELEIKFDLERGKSILVADREFERPERRATKHERFRGAQSGLDPHAIGNELKALRERSDGAQSFRAGIEAAGYVLARGDRRDFVVVDQAGGDHSLTRRLGMKVAELRTFMKDIDAGSLPSVAEARARQQVCRAAHEARQTHGRAGQGSAPPDQEKTRTGGLESGPEGHPGSRKPERPLNPTQGAIRTAWTLSHTAEQLTEALAARGIGLACVTGEEARANQRARAFGKELGRFVHPLREGEIVAVNERGHVYHFDRRTTGAERGEIEKRLAGIDAGALLSVTDTKDAMREAGRAAAASARRAAREQTRPVTGIEQTILDADKAAAGDHRKFAEALDQAGLAITRATAADIAALDALRRDQELAAMITDAAGVQREPERHFGRLEEGELAAVTRRGDLFRLNPQHLETVDKRLAEGGMPLPNVTEARAAFEIERYAAATFQQEMIDIQLQRREEAIEARVARDGAREAGDQIRSTAATVERETRTIAETGEGALFKTARGATSLAGRALEGIASMIEGALDFLAGPAAAPTREEARSEEEAIREQQQAAVDLAQQREQTATQVDEMLQRSRRQQEKDLRLAQTLGTGPTAEANLGRDEYDRTREQERERERDR